MLRANGISTTTAAGVLHAEAGETIGTLSVIVPRDLETLLRIAATSIAVHHIQFLGLTFDTHELARTNGEGYIGDQARIVFTDRCRR